MKPESLTSQTRPADKRPGTSDSTSAALRKKNFGVGLGIGAVGLLVALALLGAFLSEVDQSSKSEKPELFRLVSFCVVGLGLLCLTIYSANKAAKFATWESEEWSDTTHLPASRLALLIGLQFVLCGLLYYLIKHPLTLERLWLILLVPVGLSIVLSARWGLGVVLRTSVGTALASIAILSYGIVRLQGKFVWNAIIQFSFGVVFTVTFTLVAVAAERSRQEAERKRKEKENDLILDRSRFAREMQDVLGHFLTVMQLQIETARVLMNEDQNRALESLAKAETRLQDCLKAIRYFVASWRSPPPGSRPLLETLASLVAENQEEEIQTEMVCLGETRHLRQEVEDALLRMVREGLANVRQHASAKTAKLILDFGNPAKIKLRITDDGQGAQTTTGGFGLTFLRERAQILGGELRVQTAPTKGFTLEVELPG